MSIFEIIIISVSLGMDAFAIAICKGIMMPKKDKKINSVIIGLYFGFFQAIMPLFGYLFTSIFVDKVFRFTRILAFIILLIIAISFIVENNKKNIKVEENVKFKEMIALSFATSIDAFTVGISFAILKTSILFSCIVIGIITFLMCVWGVNIGHQLNDKLKNNSKLIAGIILIIIALKILLNI